MLKTHYGETLLLVLSLVMGFIMAIAVILLDGIAFNISNVFKIWAMISLVIILVSIFLPYKDWSAAFCRRLGLKEGTLAWKLTDGIIPSLVLNTFNTAIVSGANIFYNKVNGFELCLQWISCRFSTFCIFLENVAATFWIYILQKSVFLFYIIHFSGSQKRRPIGRRY